MFLIHGLGQGPEDMDGLAANLQDGFVGIDPLRFRLDQGFISFDSCASVGYSTCPAACTIATGGQNLGDYIRGAAPPGDIILIGFSLGGLLARDLIVKNYNGVLSGRTVTLITLGTPNLGYPHAIVPDDQAFCPYLVQGMAGNWRAIQPNGWPMLSPDLYSLTQSWQSGTFPGTNATNGLWLAAYGRSCAIAKRPNDNTTGCRDSNALSDGVVCADSASYNIPASPAVMPVTWFDPDQKYVHSVAGFGLAPGFVLCGNDGSTLFRLNNPPPFDDLFTTVRNVINGR